MNKELTNAIYKFLLDMRDCMSLPHETRLKALELSNLLYNIHPPLVNEKADDPVTRKMILEDAISFITKDRNVAHGEPEDSFKNIAKYWDAYLSMRIKRKDYATFVDSVDVAIMMVLFKVARLTHSPDNADNWIDISGYAGCGGEIACNQPSDKIPSRSNAQSATKSALDEIDLTEPI